MIPRKLELKNFLSYGEQIQTIDFSRHSLICLSGKNGNGKTALLDALTWAIWGHARKITGAVKPDEGLLRLGQTKMMVAVEFDFNQSIYRVRREFAKTYGKPYLALDFEIYNAEHDKFLPLTEKTLRQTQEKIEQTLGLDFETFVNSAFLRQGQANEFSQKSPRDRKIILANILGLAKFDKLQQLATEKIRQLNDEKRLLLHAEERINAELTNEPELRLAHTENLKSIDVINKNIETQQHILQKTLEQKNRLLEQKKAAEQIQEELGKLNEKETYKISELDKNIREWRTIHAKSLHIPDLEKLEAEKKVLLEQEKNVLELRRTALTHHEEIIKNKGLYQKRLAFLESNFEKKLNELKLAVERSEFALAQNKKLFQQKTKLVAELVVKIEDNQKEADSIKKKLKGKELFQQTANTLKSQFEKRRIFYQSLVDRGNYIKNEKNDLEERKLAIEDINNPACPFCEQMLTAKRKHFLGSKLFKTEFFLNNRLTRITNILKKLKLILLEQHKQVQNIDKEFDLYKQFELKQADLSKKIIELNQELSLQKKELETLAKNEVNFSGNLAQEKELLTQQDANRLTHFAKDSELETIAKQITGTEKIIARIDKDLLCYSQLQENIKKIELIIQDFTKIQQEQKTQPQRKSLISMLGKDLKEHRQSIAVLKQKLESILFDKKTEQALENTLLELKAQINHILKQKETLTLQIGRIDSELARLEKLNSEVKTRKDKIKTLDQEIDDYQTLSAAFGKNGIQALLIENAIPEIESEANRILSKLTDNQAQIFIESLRDLKSGGVKETMEIQISDAAGIRPYEMYSGGEAFRVDFALRIAISKLLAHRAGTALQTLIIDEGFGSQDEEGLARVMNAIHSIQDDFLKIIIVSHLPEFKDNFPIHFIIEKNSTGSIVKVEERG